MTALMGMKIFKSLNCQLCKAPFVGSATKPKSPRGLECGGAICKECFEREKILKKEKRKHQCSAQNCLGNGNPAHFLIDLLAHEALVLLVDLGGYLLLKIFKTPECGICHEEYSLTDKEKLPYDLVCGHAMCTGCFLKIRTLNLGETKKQQYWIKCPVCAHLAKTTCEKRNTQLHAFLKELPDLVMQFYDMKASSERFCDNCRKMNNIDGMSHCCKCKTQICRPCQGKKHRSHEATPLCRKELEDLCEEMRESSINKVKAYEELLPELHENLVANITLFREKLLQKEDRLKLKTKFKEARAEYQQCKLMKETFEELSKQYFPQVKAFDAKVKEMLNQL